MVLSPLSVSESRFGERRDILLCRVFSLALHVIAVIGVSVLAEALKDHDSEVGYLIIVAHITSTSNIKSSESLHLHGS